MESRDFLLQLAYKFGFEADTIWNDEKNSALRQLRQNPNILLPGDVLYIPEQAYKEPAAKDLATGQTNSFTADAPTVTLTCKFVGAETTTFASRAYTVKDLDQLTGLTTDGDGVATFKVPVTLPTATIVFTDTGDSFALNVGAMDPINTLPGTFKRLQNLGYIDRDATPDLDLARSALIALRASQPGSPGTAANPPPSGGAASDPAPSVDPGAPPDPSAPPAESSAPDPTTPDASEEAGLADDGTLDASMATLLTTSHGC
jgi:hypothetical protein